MWLNCRFWCSVSNTEHEYHIMYIHIHTNFSVLSSTQSCGHVPNSRADTKCNNSSQDHQMQPNATVNHQTTKCMLTHCDILFAGSYVHVWTYLNIVHSISYVTMQLPGPVCIHACMHVCMYACMHVQNAVTHNNWHTKRESYLIWVCIIWISFFVHGAFNLRISSTLYIENKTRTGILRTGILLGKRKTVENPHY